MFNQLLLVGGEKLRVLHILQCEVTLIRVFLLLFLLFSTVRRQGALICVEDPVQEELHCGLLGLAGRVGWTMDRVVGDHTTCLREKADKGRHLQTHFIIPSNSHMMYELHCQKCFLP